MKKCPRGLRQCNSECNLGLQHVESNGEGGCPWGINDALSGFCFWEYMKKHDAQYTDKEVSRLLCIPTAVVKATVESAFEKLKTGDSLPHLQILLGDMLRAETPDDSIYDSADEDPHIYSRHRGEYGDNMVHNNGKAQVYGLSRKWFNHIKKDKYKMTKGIK